MQCPSVPNPERIQDKPETTPPNKTGACTDYFAVAGVHTDINHSLPANQQVTAGPQLRGALAWYATDNTTNKLAHVSDGLVKHDPDWRMRRTRRRVASWRLDSCQLHRHCSCTCSCGAGPPPTTLMTSVNPNMARFVQRDPRSGAYQQFQ